MTVSIEIEEQTARTLQARADALGITLAAYIRSMADAATHDLDTNGTSAVEFDALLDEFFARNPRRLPSLPRDLSRADLYPDHD